MSKRRGGGFGGPMGGGGGAGGNAGMMKQIQKMQEDMALAQEALADHTQRRQQ